jgi:3-hydroxyacyl-[acyl-carrier-protein] dehydratase
MTQPEPATVTVTDPETYLPHRDPMLMVDRLEHVVPGARGEGVKTFPANHRVFAGHMPGAPIFPGVLLIEAIAQTGAIVLLCGKGPPPSDRAAEHGHLVRVENVRFRKPVFPGMELRCKVEITAASQPPLYHIKGKAFADGKLAATAEVIITVPEGLV